MLFRSCVMFRVWTIGIILGYWVVLSVCLEITARRYIKEKDVGQQFGECFFLSWLTMTNLETTRAARICRLVSAYYWFVVYSITLVTVTIIANIDPDIVNLPDIVQWSEMPIVQNISVLNAMVAATIGAGLLSLYLDLIYAWIGWVNVFHLPR